MIFNACTFARSWASVALAQSDDKGRPALYRTTLIESFPTGIRIIATDSYLLLKAWVPSIAWTDSPEPGIDEIPEETAICRDVDHRVLGLMKYALKLSASDGSDTKLRIKMGVGQLPAMPGQLAGMIEETCWFQFDEMYDERIEAPQFEGAFPEWRNIWFGHAWQQTGLVTFGAAGILRLGKLSSLWGQAALEFQLGGRTGVAKVIIQAPNVNVSGLAMPYRSDAVDHSSPIAEPVLPPSDEGVEAQYGDVVEKWLADVFATEQAAEGDPVVDAAVEAQIVDAAKACIDVGYGSVAIIVEALGVSEARAGEVIQALLARGVLGEGDTDDSLMRQAMELVVRKNLASTSMLQRTLKVGSGRAARLLELLEQRGVLGPVDGKTRPVLMTVEQLDALPEVILLDKYAVLVDSVEAPVNEPGDEEPI